MHRSDGLYLICWQMKMFILIWNWFIQISNDRRLFSIDPLRSKHGCIEAKQIDWPRPLAGRRVCVWNTYISVVWYRSVLYEIVFPFQFDSTRIMWFMVMMFKKTFIGFCNEISYVDERTIFKYQIHMWIYGYKRADAWSNWFYN